MLPTFSSTWPAMAGVLLVLAAMTPTPALAGDTASLPPHQREYLDQFRARIELAKRCQNGSPPAEMTREPIIPRHLLPDRVELTRAEWEECEQYWRSLRHARNTDLKTRVEDLEARVRVLERELERERRKRR